MSNLLDEYNKRLHQRDILSYDVTILKDIESNNPKFESNGKIKSFYGSTCIAWIDQQSDLFKELCKLQKNIRDQFEQAGVKEMAAFLEPASFHMTVCDIDASPDHTQVQPFDRIDHLQKTLEQIGRIGGIHAQIQGIGLKATITAQVRFKSDNELKKVLDIEQTIKMTANTDVRNFTGHISLAYFVRYPGEKIQTIKDILIPYDHHLVGNFTFSEFDLTYFTDMNTFIPVLTINLINSTVLRHESKLKELKSMLV